MKCEKCEGKTYHLSTTGELPISNVAKDGTQVFKRTRNYKCEVCKHITKVSDEIEKQMIELTERSEQ